MKSTVLIWVAIVTVVIFVYGWLDPAIVKFPPCPFRTLTGILCPGCGSQRAIHQLLHGNFLESFRLNALFIPTLLYGLSGMIVLLFFPRHWPHVRKKFYGLTAAYVSLSIILIYAIGRNIV